MITDLTVFEQTHKEDSKTLYLAVVYTYFRLKQQAGRALLIVLSEPALQLLSTIW